MGSLYAEKLRDWASFSVKHGFTIVKKNKQHILAITSFVCFAVLLFHKGLFAGGTLMYVDMTWPSSLERTFQLFSTTWFPYGSYPNIENVQRVAWVYPLLVFSMVLNLPIGTYLLLLFALTFCTAGVTMYVLVHSLLTKGELNFRVEYYLVSIIAGFLYMFNPWSLGHFWTYFQYPTYALLPLITFFLTKAIQNRRRRNVLFTAVAATFASTHPNGVIWILALILMYSIFDMLVRWAGSRIESLKKTLIVISGIMGFYVVFNAYWLLPYLYSSAVSVEGITTHYLFTPSMLDRLSRNNSFLNTLRFVSGEGFPVEHYSDNLIWIVFGFSFPILAFSSILFRRRRETLIFLTMSSITIFLAMGTMAPIPQIYRWLAFDSPISNWIGGWVFRAPDRWLSITSLCYSVMSALSLRGMIEKARKLQSRIAKASFMTAAGVLVISTSLFFCPLAEKYANFVFSPVSVPPDYDEVNCWLREQTNESRVCWLPPYSLGGYYPSWAPDRRIGPYNIFSSEYPTTAGIRSPTIIAFENWVNRDIISANSTNVFGRLAAQTSSNFIIVDKSVDTSSLASSFLEGTNDAQPIYRTDILSVYETDYSSSPAFFPSTTAVIIEGGLEKFNSMHTLMPKALDPQDVAFAFSDQVSADIFQWFPEEASILVAGHGNNSFTKMMFAVNTDGIAFFKPSIKAGSTNEFSWANIYDFHSVLRRFDIEIRPLYDLISFAEYPGATLNAPFELSEGGTYRFYMNLLSSQFGETIEVSIDGIFAKAVHTESQVNSFSWRNVCTVDLNEGEHMVTLENIAGLNAVDSFALVPSERISSYVREAYQALEDWRIIYVLEGESNFYHDNSQVSDRYGNGASNGEVLTLGEDGAAWASLEIFRNATYTLALRCAARDNISVNLGNESFELVACGNELSWKHVCNVALDVGTYDFSITSNDMCIDLFAVYPEDDGVSDSVFEDELAPRIIRYEPIGPTKYVISANASTPCVLAFAEAYNPLWCAYVDGGEASWSFPLYSAINGFKIDKTGYLQITVEYVPQRLFRYGLLITGISLSGSAAYILLKAITRLYWKRRKNGDKIKRLAGSFGGG